MMMREKHFLALLLFIGLMGSFISMLDWELGLFSSLFAAPFNFSGLRNGFLLIFNRLFAISEQRQLFRYVFFPITSPESDWNGNIAAAFVVIAAIFASLSITLVHMRSKLPAIAAMIVVVGVQVYFGVFPSAIWNIVLFAAFAMILAAGHTANRRVSISGNTTIIAALVMVALVVWVAYPGKNLQLHEFSESIRDRFDTRINPFSVTPFDAYNAGHEPEPEDIDFRLADVQDETLHEMAMDDYIIEFDERAQGAEIGFVFADSLLWAVLFVIALIIIGVLYVLVPPLWRAAKRRRTFDLDDSPTAINNMFVYLLEWLAVCGLERKNVVFSAYAVQLSSLMSPQYSKEYENITVLWQKAVYSSHTPGEAERKHMRAFLDKTTSIVWKQSNIATKIKIKFQYFL